MTHTLHRLGTEPNLSNDYVILAMAAKGINEEGSADKLREFLRICERHRPANMGDMRTGNVFTAGAEEVIARVTSTSIVHSVFNDPDAVAQVLQDVKNADLGMSIVVSSLFRSARECCAKAGLAPHTVENSLGIWGKRDRLPPQEVLEVTTMCGHGMIAPSLVTAVADDARAGRVSAQDASVELARQCACGVFNPTRAVQLLEVMSSR